ncbi:hypothetical protein K0M31_005776 [Melipona bicolor]|uniref:Uncharacterized protein n=1 Tax=Melipona bicolor TaxID=60889 RepID=A0AA40FU27_9HYME|nr:hypothetical protein K0M31_005776 [Melipona bicolor]
MYTNMNQEKKYGSTVIRSYSTLTSDVPISTVHRTPLRLDTCRRAKQLGANRTTTGVLPNFTTK